MARAITIPTPEMDGSSMASVSTLLAGAGVLLADRARRRLKASKRFHRFSTAADK
jgi:hypothetical protein